MLEPLLTRSFRISYAKASDLATKIGEFKSKDPNSFVKVDERTNIMIVRDRARNLDDIQGIVDTLDQPEPAVRIEARIVEVKDTAGQELGIEWGATKINDAAHGNALNYGFPNSMQLGGGIQTAAGATAERESARRFACPSPTRRPGAARWPDPREHRGYILAGHQTPGDGDVGQDQDRLESLDPDRPESEGEDPCRREDSHGGDRRGGQHHDQFMDVGVTLEVTPQITAEGSIFLDLMVKKDSRVQPVISKGKEEIAIDAKEAIPRSS